MESVSDVLESLTEGMGCRLVLAAERGSRAFGTDGPDSDYDMVAYVVMPARRYLGLQPPPMTHGTRKFAGGSLTPFDVRRGLSDALRGNVMAWTVANSLCVHVDEAGLRQAMADLGRQCHNDRSALFQYANYTAQAVRKVMKPGHAEARDWLHVLQPMLSFRHVREHSGPAPVDFSELVAASSRNILVEASASALAAKRGDGDGVKGPLALAVLEEAEAVAEEARSLADAERVMDPEMAERADGLAVEVTESLWSP